MWFYCCTCFGQSCFATQLEAVLVVSHEIHHGTTQSQLGRSADHPQCHHPLPKQFGCDETAELQTASDWSFGFLSNELDVFLALRCLKQAKKASSDTVDWYNNIYIIYYFHVIYYPWYAQRTTDELRAIGLIGGKLLSHDVPQIDFKAPTASWTPSRWCDDTWVLPSAIAGLIRSLTSKVFRNDGPQSSTVCLHDFRWFQKMKCWLCLLV